MSATKPATMWAMNLKHAYQLTGATGRKDRCEIRDTARNNVLVFSGTYKQCMAEAKRRGISHS